MGVIAVISGTKMKRLQVSNFSLWFLNTLILFHLVSKVGSSYFCYNMFQFPSSKKGRVREDVTWPTSVGLS